MKKKIVSLCLVIALAAIAIVGASLAYFTDTDDATNTFAVGNVIIDLIEQQRGKVDGKAALVDFEQNQKLYPIVGEVKEMDNFQLPDTSVTKNYVDKVVTVKNTGSEAAWVRAYFAIPSALDGGYDNVNSGLDVLHFDYGCRNDGACTEGVEWYWEHTDADNVTTSNYFETSIGGIAYNVYYADYYTTLEASKTTERLINGVYLDKNVDYDEGDYYFGTTKLTVDEDWDWDSVSCPVFAVAVQAAGFENADEAVTAAFGAKYNPWGGTVTNWK